MERLPTLKRYEAAVRGYFQTKKPEYPSPNIVNKGSIQAVAAGLLQLHERMVERTGVDRHRESIRSSLQQVFGLGSEEELGLKRRDVLALVGNKEQSDLEAVVHKTLEKIKAAVTPQYPAEAKATIRMNSRRGNMGWLGDFFFGGGGGGGGGRKSPKKKPSNTTRTSATRNTGAKKKKLNYTTEPNLSNQEGKPPKWKYFRKNGKWYRMRVD